MQPWFSILPTESAQTEWSGIFTRSALCCIVTLTEEWKYLNTCFKKANGQRPLLNDDWISTQNVTYNQVLQ